MEWVQIRTGMYPETQQKTITNLHPTHPLKQQIRVCISMLTCMCAFKATPPPLSSASL